MPSIGAKERINGNIKRVDESVFFLESYSLLFQNESIWFLVKKNFKYIISVTSAVLQGRRTSAQKLCGDLSALSQCYLAYEHEYFNQNYGTIGTPIIWKPSHHH